MSEGTMDSSDRVSAAVSDVSTLKSLTMIELPCFVKTSATALSMLGGEESVCRALAHDDSPSLQCRLPGDNPLRSSLESSSISNRGIVLKLKRKKMLVNGKKVSVVTSVVVVGAVRKAFGFTSPADFQFLPSSLDTPVYSSPSLASQLPLEIVPQRFSRTEYDKGHMQFLQFLHVPKKQKRPPTVPSAASVSNVSGAQAAAEEKTAVDEGDSDGSDGRPGSTLRARNPDAGFTPILKFIDPIPTQHPLGLYPPRWLAKREKTGESFRGFVLIDRLRELFSVLAVWKRQQLVDILGLGARQHLFRECLPYVAYSYCNGPFVNLWVRYGYDPRTDPQSFIYQQLHVRLPLQFLKPLSDQLTAHLGPTRVMNKLLHLDTQTLDEGPEAFSHKFISKGAFARLPLSLCGYMVKQQISFQVHSMTDPPLAEFVCSLPRSAECAEHTGWFTAEAAARFRVFLAEYLQQKANDILALSPESIAFTGSSSGQTQNTLMTSSDIEVLQQRLQTFQQVWQQYSSQTQDELLASTPPGVSDTMAHFVYWLQRYQRVAEELTAGQQYTISSADKGLREPRHRLPSLSATAKVRRRRRAHSKSFEDEKEEAEVEGGGAEETETVRRSVRFADTIATSTEETAIQPLSMETLSQTQGFQLLDRGSGDMEDSDSGSDGYGY